MNFSNLFKLVSRLPLNRVRAERGADVRGGGVTTGEKRNYFVWEKRNYFCSRWEERTGDE